MLGAVALFLIVLVIVGVAVWGAKGGENKHKARENSDAMAIGPPPPNM